MRDDLTVHIKWTLTKYQEGEDVPFEVVDLGENAMTTVGLQRLLDIIQGDQAALAETTSFIGVGDSTTAFSAGHTDLQAATNKLRKGMNSTYPSRVGQVLTFQADFLTGEANFVWNEWGLFTAISSGVMISRKVQSLGTKASGTWTMTGAFTLA